MSDTNKCCELCRFWEYFDEADESEGDPLTDTIGTCQRWPPVYRPENPALFDVSGAVDMRPHSPREWTQPITLQRDWCGEFKANGSTRSFARTDYTEGIDEHGRIKL